MNHKGGYEERVVHTVNSQILLDGTQVCRNVKLMRVAVVTPVFLGGFGEFTHLKGALIGGAEVYLHTFIKEVLEEVASEIVVYQERGFSARFSKKTSVKTVSSLKALKLDGFDLAIINKLELASKLSRSQLSRVRSIAIHHGMSTPPALTLDALKTYYEHDHAFPLRGRKIRGAIRRFFGRRIEDLARVLFWAVKNLKKWKTAVMEVNRCSDLVDCVVSVDKDSLRYVHPSRRVKWRVIYNFVDLNLFKPSFRDDPSKEKRILVPRNLTTYRGTFIIPKLAYLLKRWGYRDFKFLIAGSGHLRPFLERETERLKVSEEVALCGHQDHFRDMPRLYAESDIVLVPSLASEGTSLAVLEGMASRKPVVTTDVGGIKDIGVNGIHKLSSPFNIKKIGRNIARLMEDEDLTERISEAGYRYVRRNHNLQLWKERWRRIIDEMLLVEEQPLPVELIKVPLTI